MCTLYATSVRAVLHARSNLDLLKALRVYGEQQRAHVRLLALAECRVPLEPPIRCHEQTVAAISTGELQPMDLAALTALASFLRGHTGGQFERTLGQLEVPTRH